MPVEGLVDLLLAFRSTRLLHGLFQPGPVQVPGQAPQEHTHVFGVVQCNAQLARIAREQNRRKRERHGKVAQRRVKKQKEEEWQG